MNQNEQLNRRTFIKSRVTEGLIAGGVATSVILVGYSELKTYENRDKKSSESSKVNFDQTGLSLPISRINPRVYDLNTMNEFFGWSVENPAGFEIPSTHDIYTTPAGLSIVNNSQMDLGISESGLQFLLNRLPKAESALPLLYITDEQVEGKLGTYYNDYMGVFESDQINSGVCLVKANTVLKDFSDFKILDPYTDPFEIIWEGLTYSAFEAVYYQRASQMKNNISEIKIKRGLKNLEHDFETGIMTGELYPFIFPLDKLYRPEGNPTA